MVARNSKALEAVVASFGVSTEERLLRLDKMDLSNVSRKLMEPEPEGKAWTKDQVLEAEKWYRRFLAAIIKYPNAIQVPNLPIDQFWHQHILDTRAYAKDCEHVMGRFIHHYPYYGMNGDADQRDDSFDETNEVYRLMFGEDCTQMSQKYDIKAQNCTAPCSSEACGTGCSKCMVDGQAVTKVDATALAVGCGGGGSGTGCGQRCGRNG